MEKFSKEPSNNFKFELCTHPLSLFDKNCFLRNAEKAELANITTSAKYFPGNKDILGDNKQYEFDGGALLQKLPW